MKSKKSFSIFSFIRLHPMIVAFCFSSLIAIVMIGLSAIRWESTDDYTISQILMGAPGQSSAYVLTINVFFGKLISVLHAIIPVVNWLTVFELLAVWLSFALLGSVLLKIFKSGLYIFLALVLMVSFEMQFFMTLTYTRSAFLLTFSAAILAAEGYINAIDSMKESEKDSPLKVSRYILIIALFGFGCLFRNKCGYVSIAFSAVLAFFPTLRFLRHNGLKEKRFLRQLSLYAAVLVAMVLISGVLSVANSLLYKKWNAQNDYVAFNKARADFCDYLPSSYPAEWKNEGITENDYLMVKYFIINDNVFNLSFYECGKEALQAINQSSNNTPLNREKFINSITKYHQGRYYDSSSAYIIVLAFFVLALLLSDIGYYPEILACFTGALIIASFFISSDRLPPWVMDSLFFESSYIFGYVITKSNPRVNYANQRFIGLGIVSFCLYICCIPVVSKEKGVASRATSDIKALLEYARSTDELFLLDGFFDTYQFVDEHTPLYGYRQGEMKNLIRVGCWDIKHPVREQQKQYWNIESVISSLIEGKSKLIAYRTSNFETYRKFFIEHHGIEIGVSCEKVFGNFGIYSFHEMKEVAFDKFVHNDLVAESVFGLSVFSGGMVSGPYEYLESGYYRIVYTGENLDKGHFEIYSATDGDAIQYSVVEKNELRVVIEVSVNRDVNSIEYLTYNRDETCVIQLGSIKVEKIR